jgi:hypothetical protein
MLKIFLDLPLGWLLLIASVVIYLILFMVVYGAFALVVKRARPTRLFRAIALVVKRARSTLRYRFWPVAFRLTLWQFMAAILVLGSLLELAILAHRAYRAYQIAEGHSLSASVYRGFQNPNSPYYIGEVAGPSPGYLFSSTGIEGSHVIMSK